MEALVAIELADFCKCEKRPPETCSGSTGREPAGGRRRRSCSPDFFTGVLTNLSSQPGGRRRRSCSPDFFTASLIEKSELGEREERLRAEP